MRKFFRPKKSNLIIVIALLAIAALACTCGNVTNLTGGGGGGGGPALAGAPTYDGGDGYTTGFVREIQVGGSQSATINNVFVAHNYVFQGTAGQSITASASGVADTRIKIIDPNGRVVAEVDDTNGLDPQVTFNVNSNGWWTVRVDAFTEGDYTVTIR